VVDQPTIRHVLEVDPSISSGLERGRRTPFEGATWNGLPVNTCSAAQSQVSAKRGRLKSRPTGVDKKEENGRGRAAERAQARLGPLKKRWKKRKKPCRVLGKRAREGSTGPPWADPENYMEKQVGRLLDLQEEFGTGSNAASRPVLRETLASTPRRWEGQTRHEIPPRPGGQPSIIFPGGSDHPSHRRPWAGPGHVHTLKITRNRASCEYIFASNASPFPPQVLVQALRKGFGF